MTTKTNSQRLLELRKKRKEEEKNSSTTSINKTYKNSDRAKKLRLERNIGFDTFESDLNSLGKTVQDIYDGWQTQDTMSKTKTTIRDMQTRIDAYNEYQKMFGGADLSDTSEKYKTILKDLKNRTQLYGQYKDADSYTKEMTKFSELDAMSMEDIEPYLKDKKNPLAYTTVGGQEITWQSLYEDKKHKKFSTSKEGKLGYEQFLKEEKKAKEKAEKEEAEKPWYEKVLEIIGNTPDSTLPTAQLNQVIKDKSKDNSYQKPTKDWTQEELNIFGGYWYEKDYEGAYNYAANLNNAKAMAEKNFTKEDIGDSATSGFWAGAGHWGASILSAPFGLADYLDDLTDVAAGRNVIVEEGTVTPFEYSQTVNSSQATALNDWSGTLNENILIIGGRGAGDIYGLGTSIVNSKASALTMGSVGTLLNYFGQASASGVDDAVSRGATAKQAILLGTAQGLAEAIPEMISADKFLKLGKASNLGFLGKVRKQAREEGTEELVTALLSNAADNAIMQEKSNFNSKVSYYKSKGLEESEAKEKAWLDFAEDIAYDALGGYISGGISAAPIAAISTKSENKFIKKSYGEVTDELIAQGLESGKDTESYKLAEKAKEKIDSGKELSVKEITQLVEANDAAYKMEIKIDAESRLAKHGSTVDNSKVAEIIAKKSMGEELTKSEIKTLQNNKYANRVYNEINNEELVAYTENMSESEADLFLSQYDAKTNGKVSQFSDSFNLVKELSEKNYSADYILEHKGVLSEKQVSAIYKDKVLNSDASLEKAITALKEKHEGTAFIEGTFDDSVINYDNTNVEGKVNWNSLNSNQKKAIAVLGQVGKRAGMDVELISDGLERGINGAFEISGNKMLIDIYAGMDKVDGSKLQDTIIPTTSHEMTHWMKSKSPTLYRKYDNYVFGTLTMSGKSEAEILAARRKKMEAAHPGEKFTDAEVRDEVIARASEDMFANSKEIKQFLDTLTDSEKKSFVERVKEILQNVKEWLNDFLSKQKSTSDEAKIIRQYADRIDGQIELWDKMLISSISANQALKKEGITGEKLANKTSNNVQEMARDRYWYPQMSNTELAYVRRIAKYELPKTDNYLDENTKWLYNVKNGNTFFALYSTADVNEPTILYACKGNQAQFEHEFLIDEFGEEVDIDERIVERAKTLDKILSSYGYVISGKNVSNRNVVGGRSNNRNVGVHSQNSGIRPNEALFDCLRNIREIQKRNERNRLEQYSDRDTLESRYSELQKEYTQLEKEAEALKQSEEYLNFLDSISLLQGEELDNAIKEYGEWTHKSGLYDKSKRMSEIIGEQKDIRAALDNEKELSRDAYMKSIENLTEKEKMDFVNKAVKRFGTTNRLSLASYLMLNGKMLDFSEGQGYRVQDHREISEILDMPDTTGYSDGLIAFMNMGNIRLQTYGIDISQVPNQTQKSALRDIISQVMRDNDEFSVDFSKANGYTDGSVTYPKGTATSKILADIDSYFETGVVPEYESSIAEFRYSDRDTDIETQINQSMTMAECKDMIQRAFVLGGIQEWYDGEYKNGDEWLKAQGADEVALYIENEYALQQKYIDKIQGVIDDEFYVADILEAYLKGTLIGKEKPKTKRLDLSVNHRINDTRFYSPQRIENVKQLFEVASQKLTSKNRAEVSNARAKILLFAHNKGASELLGLTQAELNKKLRTWGGYPANARDMSRRFNNGVADSNKWTGIENCSWLYRSTVTTDELESLVKSVTGAADDYEKLYIARTMLALDTHIDWSWVSFEFDSHANINKNRNKNDRCNGFYSNDKRKVVVSHNMPNTVAHEMGHALDYQWGRDLGYQYDALTEVSQNTQRITDPQTKQFFDNFKIFMDSLTDNGDIRSEYTQNPKEVFARFIARFVEWVDNTGTGNHSYRTESMYYNDKFTASNYIEFVKLLQEKAMLDSKKMAEGEDVKFSDRDSEGNELSKEQMDFFANSKVRDAEGNLIPVYHGTYENFTIFDINKTANANIFGKGHYFTSSEEDAHNNYASGEGGDVKTKIDSLAYYYFEEMGYTEEDLYDNDHIEEWNKAYDKAEEFYESGKVMKVYLNITNPVYANDTTELYDKDGNFISARSIEGLKELGFDGIIDYHASEKFDFQHLDEGTAHFVVFDSNQIKLTTNTNPTSNPDIRYSDRDNVSVYDTMGETDRLIKENTQLKEDVERLKERLKIERQVTHGNYFNKNQLDAVAGHIRKIANSTYDKKGLVTLLDGVYSYIANSPDLNWYDMFAQCYDIASMVLDEAKPITERNEYYEMILRDIRGKKISVDSQHIQNAKYRWGNRWHNKFFNRVKITDNAISLDSQWQEWASDYPDIFDAEISPADQLVELYDIYDSVKEGSELVVEYDIEEQTRWLAREIYNQYWNVSPIRTTADKYDKKIKLLNFEHRRTMKEFRDSYEAKLKAQHKSDRAKAAQLVKELRDRKDKEIAEVKQKSKERMDAYKDNAARKTKIQSITAKALTLNEWLLKNSKEKHIHESLKAPVANLLQAIDFSSKQLLGMRGGENKGMPTQKDISLQKALGQVKDMMLEASVGKEELIDLYGHDLDDDIKSLVESVDNIMRTVGDNEFILNKMTLNDLKTLDNMLKTIKQAVTKMNQFHSVHHARGIASLGQEEIRYAEKLGNEKIYVERSFKSDSKKMLKWHNSVPYYAFKRFGEAGKKIFEAFQDGWDKMAFNVKEVIDFTKKTYTSKEVREWEKEIKSFDILVPATETETSDPNYKPKSQKVQMTTAQVMYLYLLNKRAAAKPHLLGGGIKISDIETKKSEVISQPDDVLFEQSEIDKIIKSLNSRQIAVANALSKFMNTVCSDWGNEVSMARFGYKAFGEPDYVPMNVDKDEISTADPAEKNNSLFKLLNMSFTKGLTEGANNRLVISSIFDVFAQHTSDMAKYNALALPVLDAFKWYNYKEIEYVGEEAKVRNTVKKSIGKAFGKDGQNYITTLLEDINGQNNVSRDTLSNRFFKNSKLASVGMNLRVILLQPTSYFRASANIDKKYLIKALAHKSKIAYAEKYCGMALWKSLGYYDTNIQRGVAEQIKHAEKPYDKLIEWSMKGAGEADRLTLGYLWNAAELEIRETRKDLRVGSEEFFLEVGKRLRDIIYSTQVVDSTLTRSQMMRSADKMDKVLTAFMSEPTLAYNILQDVYIQTGLDARELGSKKAALKKNGKKIARAITAYTVTNAVAALIESGFDAWRDDDDEEMDIVEFMKLYLANFAADMSIVGKIPYLKDGLSILQGYSPSRSDLQWMQSAYYALSGIRKHLQGEGNPVATVKNSIKTFSYLSGLPFYNAYRDTMATLDKLDIISSEELEEMFKDLFGIE